MVRQCCFGTQVNVASTESPHLSDTTAHMSEGRCVTPKTPSFNLALSYGIFQYAS